MLFAIFCENNYGSSTFSSVRTKCNVEISREKISEKNGLVYFSVHALEHGIIELLRTRH